MAEVDERLARKPWLGPVLEVVVCMTAMVVMTLSAMNVKVDPLKRIGQVSALSSLQLRYIWIVFPILLLLFASAKLRKGAWFPMTSRLTCAAFAGLVSGFCAGGLIVALRGTEWCLNANEADMRSLVHIADLMMTNPDAGYPHPLYPPLFPYILRWYMQLSGLQGYFAMQDLQIAGTALFGPAAYLSWRLLLRPGWALAIGVVASLQLIESYKPYSQLTLVVMIPVLIRFMQQIRTADQRTTRQLVQAGVVFGLGFGVLLLLYSGWFRWAAPGAVVAGLCVAPWRTGKARAALFIGVTLVMFALVTWSYWTNVATYSLDVSAATASGAPDIPLINDGYIYFDVRTDPAYVAMWKGDLHGVIGNWPPHGELAGIGLYTILVLGAIGIAIAFGRRRTVVITLGCVLAGAWFLRFWYAHFLWNTKLVQLYPRTSMMIAYAMVLLAGYAVYYMVEHHVRKHEPSEPLRRSGMLGALCAFALLFGMAASSLADRYMPASGEPRGPGWLTWVAHEAHKNPKP